MTDQLVTAHSTDSLLPCPFCGGTATHTTFDDRSFVMCVCCGAQCDSLDTLPESSPIDAWNRREADLEAARKQGQEDALNACITFVVHGSADFKDLPPGLSVYFQEQVKFPIKMAVGALKLVQAFQRSGDYLFPNDAKKSVNKTLSSLNPLVKMYKTKSK